MEGENIIIKFDDTYAFICESVALDLIQLALPPVAVKFEPSYWYCTILKYFEAEQRIFCKINSYHKGAVQFDARQLSLTDYYEQIEKINFSGIDTVGLLKCLAPNQLIVSEHPPLLVPNLEPLGKYNEDDLLIDEEDDIDEESSQDDGGKTPKQSTIPVVPQQPAKKTQRPLPVETRHFKFTVPLKNVKFDFGCVTFEKICKPIFAPISFTIYNSEIREEFDAVKEYFGNVLQTKKIEVTAQVDTQGWKVTATRAQSSTIAKITKDIIESVKFEFVKGFGKRKIDVELHNHLFTMDELFGEFSGNKLKGSTFYNQENDFFEDLLHLNGTKHEQQLRYLASMHVHKVMKLRFVLKPFSFLFLLEGENQYHVVWETLNTEEATYVWHCEKELPFLKQLAERINLIIQAIQVSGKIAYIQSSEDQYQRVFHDYSNIKDGFVKWKSDIDALLY